MKIIELPKFTDERGALSFLESNNHIPFEIKRIYYLYGNTHNKIRGCHAHKKLQQAIIAINGSFTVEIDNGTKKQDFILNTPSQALLITECVWREIKNFSKDAVVLVLASDFYTEDDYIRDYNEFLKYKEIKCLL